MGGGAPADAEGRYGLIGDQLGGGGAGNFSISRGITSFAIMAWRANGFESILVYISFRISIQRTLMIHSGALSP